MASKMGRRHHLPSMGKDEIRYQGYDYCCGFHRKASRDKRRARRARRQEVRAECRVERLSHIPT